MRRTGGHRITRGGALAWLLVAALLACRGSTERSAGPMRTQTDDTRPASNNTMTNPAPRPALRRVLAAHPETVARQVPADNAARVRAYLQDHTVSPELARAIDAHEIWIGMTEDEVILSVGPATGREDVPDRPGGHALVYASEGWVLRFDAAGFLYELVER